MMRKDGESIMTGKLLIITGPSGAGKSTLIRELSKIDDRFRSVRVYTTRPLRASETEKQTVSDEVLSEMLVRGELVNINELHGYKYGPSRADIEEQLQVGNVPMIDWAPDRVSQLTKLFPNQTFVVFLQPPSRQILEERLRATNRTDRLTDSLAQLDALKRDEYTYDLLLTSTNGNIESMAARVRQVLIGNHTLYDDTRRE